MNMRYSGTNVGKVERRFFDPTMSDRERAIFEAGIALGSICHQFVGIPVAADEKLIKSIEDTIEKSAAIQPYRTLVEAKIKRRGLRRKRNPYDYGSLREEQLELVVQTKFGRAEVTARMKYVPELRYPLMYVEKTRLEP